MLSKPILNLVTNVGKGEKSGGISGLNFHIFEELSQKFEINYIQIPRKSRNWKSHLFSILRKFKIKTPLDAFDENYLNLVLKTIDKFILLDAPTLFVGITQYVNTNYSNYYVFNDCDFDTYLTYFAKRTSFRNVHLQKLIAKENTFLSRANKVFYTSQWAVDKTVKNYSLSSHKFINIGQGGNVPLPEISKKPSVQLETIKFIFMSTNFKKKGGNTAFSIVEKLNQTIKSELHVFGDKPSAFEFDLSFVHYHGWIDKDNPKDLNFLIENFTSAFALLLPTKSDILPLSIIEAGYYGCPSFTTKIAAIPSLIQHDNNGFIYDFINFEENCLEKILELNSHDEKYLELRKNTKEHFCTNYTWQKFGKELKKWIN